MRPKEGGEPAAQDRSAARRSPGVAGANQRRLGHGAGLGDVARELFHLAAHLRVVGALRVYMTRFSRNKVIAFDFDEALNFEGDTGPYLQYSLVRAGKIFRKRY